MEGKLIEIEANKYSENVSDAPDELRGLLRDAFVAGANWQSAQHGVQADLPNVRVCNCGSMDGYHPRTCLCWDTASR